MLASTPSRRKFLSGVAASALFAPSLARAVPAGVTPPISKRLTPVPLQVVATRGRIPQNIEGNATNTRFEAYLWANIGPRPVSNWRLAFCNRYNDGAEEIPALATDTTAGDYTLSAGVYWPSSSSATVMTFGGVLNPVIKWGAPLVLSDPSGPPIAAATQVRLQAGAVVTSGLKTIGAEVSASGQQYNGYESTVGTSQVYTANAWSTPSGGITATYGFIPLMMLGVPDQPHVAVAIWGDSICSGTGDATDFTTGFYGWAERAMIGSSKTQSGSACATPFVNLSRSGSTTSVYRSHYVQTCYTVLPYVSHVICADSTNDVATYTLALMQSDCQMAWAAARAAGCKVYHTTMTPKTTSSDLWATPANQTIVAGYENAGYDFATYPAGDAPAPATGTRGAFNAWLFAQVAAGALDGVLDVNAAIEDPANLGKWKTNGSANYPTTDGLHPTAAMHALMSAAVQPAIASWGI